MKNQELFNVNSLTDIISNSVGILVVFAVLNIAYEGERVYELEIPIEHDSLLAPAFFICKDNAIVFLEAETVFTHAIAQARRGLSEEGKVFPLEYLGINSQIDENLGLVLHPEDTRHWHENSEIGIADSEIRQALDKLDAKKQFAFFFVYDDLVEEQGSGSGFEIFRKARQYLKARGVKTGWRPVAEEHPPHICFWGSVPMCNYKPSYLASEEKKL
jgi:hypothetical protein